jgi:hypothetical protein
LRKQLWRELPIWLTLHNRGHEQPTKILKDSFYFQFVSFFPLCYFSPLPPSTIEVLLSNSWLLQLTQSLDSWTIII